MVNIVACGRCRGEGRIIGTPCSACQGDGRVTEERVLQVTIPAGIDGGQRIALEGQGEAGPRGGPNGDLYVAVAIRPHPELVRRGTELFHELPITFPQAALGAKLTVPTVEGSEEVEIPAGAQSGHEIRLRGKGVPRLRGAGRGDLHVVVNVVVPSKLSKRERELMRELNEIGEPAQLPKGGPSVFDRLRDLFG
jgi:molecular chaperone DnaJ